MHSEAAMVSLTAVLELKGVPIPDFASYLFNYDPDVPQLPGDTPAGRPARAAAAAHFDLADVVEVAGPPAVNTPAAYGV